MKIDLKQLISFITEANKAGYASGQDNVWKKQPDGSTTITYKNEDWLFCDNYFGGEPYGGREVVFYRNKPVFIMTYYGRICDKTFDNKVIYSFLQKALKLFPEDRPFRGPEIFHEEIGGKTMKYENDWQGEIDYFSGEEKIFIDDKEVYEAKYAGGLVDQ
jgi:hypothetical protein